MYLIWGARSGVADDPDLMEHDVPCRCMTPCFSKYRGVFYKRHTTVITYTYVSGRAVLSLHSALFLYQLDIHSTPYVSVSKPASYTDFVFSARIFRTLIQRQKQGFTFHCVYVCTYMLEWCGLLTAGSLGRTERDGVTDCGSCGIFVPRK